jgi:hypothetical protein
MHDFKLRLTRATTDTTTIKALLAKLNGCAAHLCWELLLWDVWQEALGVHIHSMASWGLHNRHPSITQQTRQQLNLPAGGH